MKIVTGTDRLVHYDYGRDIGFVCGCSGEVNALALYEFVYRTIINTNVSYWNREKIMFDGENWLADGITNYIVGKMMEHVVIEDAGVSVSGPAMLEWYGHGTQAQYGTTLLHEIYGIEAWREGHR